MRSGRGLWRAAVTASAVLVVSCGGIRPEGVAQPDEGGVMLDASTLQRVVDDTAAARQLPMTRPVPIDVVSLDAFAARLHSHEESRTEAEQRAVEAFWVGFDFIVPPDRRRETEEGSAANDIVGFYEIERDRIVLPAAKVKTELDALIQRAVLAHEVQHALQARHFEVGKSEGGQDRRLARLALIEGDAQVAMASYLALDAGIPVGRALRQILDINEDVPIESVAHGEERDDLSGSVDLGRTRVLFPYVDGALFVGDLYRAGGFELVNGAYASLPTTTEQILHPEKYVAGEGAIPIAELPVPDGYALLSSDSLGELQARELFRRCAPERAIDAAEGWGGDRYTLSSGPNKELAVAWVSAWDTEQDAKEVEALLSSTRDRCWTANAADGASKDLAVSAETTVTRSGAVVTLVRGLDAKARERLATRAATLVGPRPAPERRMAATILPREPLIKPPTGTVKGDVWRNDWLGLVGRIPEGLFVKPSEDFDLLIERSDANVMGGVSFSDKVVSPRFVDSVFREVGAAIASEVSSARLRLLVKRSGPLTTPLGVGVERVWTIEGTAVSIRLLLLPICAETGSVVLMQAYADTYGKSVLDGWFGSFRWIDGRQVPACSYLDPK